MRTVEIKANLLDVEQLSKRVATLCATAATEIKQKDTFFNPSHGRLKLRVQSVDGVAESCLIFYDRPDTTGAKLKDFDVTPVADPDSLRLVLVHACGIRGEVEKTRRVYTLGQARVHVDAVAGLGNFVEVEVVLRDDQTPEDGRAAAEELMDKLGISDADLLAGAYMDMLSGGKR